MADRIKPLARHWAEQLGEWAIPDRIMRQAPASPWGFPTDLFAGAARAALDNPSATPSRRAALEVLAAGATVLDVGAGAGAASLPLAPPAGDLVAVDESAEMLAAYQDLAAARSVPVSTVVGRWPDVADRVGEADVVVCHHVLYNVPDIVPFIRALDRHARSRVVIELTEEHPQSELNPLWRALHGIERPLGPTAGDVVALLTAMGFPVAEARFTQTSLWSHAHRDHQVEFARRRLCVGPDRDVEIARLLPTKRRRLVTLWWDRGQTPPAQ